MVSGTAIEAYIGSTSQRYECCCYTRYVASPSQLRIVSSHDCDRDGKTSSTVQFRMTQARPLFNPSICPWSPVSTVRGRENPKSTVLQQTSRGIGLSFLSGVAGITLECLSRSVAMMLRCRCTVVRLLEDEGHVLLVDYVDRRVGSDKGGRCLSGVPVSFTPLRKFDSDRQ